MAGSWKQRRMLTVGVAAGFLLALGLASAEATTIIRTGTSGSGATLRKAWIQFDQFERLGTGSDLFVTLANISPNDVTNQTFILTAVFFNLNGTPSLTRVSALLDDRVNSSGVQVTTDSSVFNCTAGGGVCPSPNSTGGSVGKEWAYQFNSAGLNPSGTGAFQVTQKHGISSAGLGKSPWGGFADADRFDTSGNLQGPNAPDGLQYGLSSFGDDAANDIMGAANDGLILNTVLFRFTVGAGYTLASVTDVRFQYGTTLEDTDIDVPLPPALMLLSSGLLAAAAVIQARRRRKAASTN